MNAKICLCICLIIGSFYGCSSTVQINSAAEAGGYLEGKGGMLVLSDSSSYRASEMHVANDSLSFTDLQTQESTTCSLRNISLVQRNNRFVGLGEGALIGAGSSYAILSYLMNEDRKKEEREPDPSASADAFRNVIVAGGTLIGGVLGALAGAEIGHPVSYVFSLPGQAATSRPHLAPRIPAPKPTIAEDPLSVKRTLKGGIDLGNSLHADRGGISEGPGYIVGLLSGFDLARTNGANIALGTELDYSSINQYYPTLSINFYGTRYSLDKMRHLAFADLALLPEIFLPVTEDLVMSTYLGASFGLGTENWYLHSRDGIARPDFLFSPLGIDSGNNFRSVVCGIAGVSFYYKHVMIDMRFRNTKATNGGAYENFYLQIGVVQ